MFALFLALSTALPQETLKNLERKPVVLHLFSGRDLEGTITKVTDQHLTIERAKVPTYVDVARIEAVTITPLSPPTAGELDAQAKTLGLTIDWPSIPDEGDARFSLQRALEDTGAAIKRIGADQEGKDALKKVSRIRLGFGSSSAVLDKGALVVRWDPKKTPAVETIQSLIEKQL
jgi:hypothetical protein